MIYLSEFYFPSQNSEANYLAESPRAKMTCYDSFYPFGLFAGRGLKALDLADVTILYGGNGSGKTTALNVMADALRLQRGAQYNRSDFFPDYVSLCQFHTLHAIPAGSLILTSDDVFDYMLDVRAINDNIDTRRGSLFDEYTEARTAKFQMHSMEDYDRLKQVSAARRYSQSQRGTALFQISGGAQNVVSQHPHPLQRRKRLFDVPGKTARGCPLSVG